jgi:hypothetical protein
MKDTEKADRNPPEIQTGYYFFNVLLLSGVRLSPLGYCGHYWAIILAPDDRLW